MLNDIINKQMAENLTPVIFNLSGNALIIGGSCIMGFGVLYGVRGMSTTMILLKSYQLISITHNKFSMMFRQNLSKNDVDNEDDIVCPHCQRHTHEASTWRTILVNNGVKSILVLAAVGLGVGLNGAGRYVTSDKAINAAIAITGGSARIR
jgi:hypothetical protein